MRNNIHHAMRNHLLSHDLHGGLSKRNTHDALIAQQLLIDITSQKKLQGTLLNVYTSKCYDRIHSNLENISLQRLDCPKSVSDEISRKTKNMNHHVHTAYGDSKTYFQSPPNEVWSGVIQGNAASGISWIAQEQWILESLDNLHQGTTIYAPSNTIKYKTQVTSYVDNNNFMIVHS